MGSGGGQQTQSSTQTVNTGPWVDQAPHLRDIFNEAGGLYSAGPAQYYNKSTVAGLNPGQSQGYNKIIQQGLAGSPLMPAANTTALNTINGQYLDPATNPYLKSTFDAAAGDVTRAYQNATAPNTDAAFAGAGRYGSGAYRNAVSNNQRDLGASLDNLATNIYGGNYANERQNQLGMTNNVGNIIQAGYLDPTAAINAGSALQNQSQKEIDADKARWDYNQNAAWQNLQRYYGIVGGNNWGQNGTTTGTQTMSAPQSDTFGQIAGGILSAAGTAGKLGWTPFSDVRLKDDITPIGKTNDGMGIYAFRYKGDPTPQIGLMAQEVERTKPDAIVEDPSGYKRVDYAKALRPSILEVR